MSDDGYGMSRREGISVDVELASYHQHEENFYDDNDDNGPELDVSHATTETISLLPVHDDNDNTNCLPGRIVEPTSCDNIHGSTEQTHCSPISPGQHRRQNSIYAELLALSGTALPALQSLVLNKVPWFISLRFLGVIGSHELASAALATTLNNVTGFSLCVGFSFALSTLSGQAKGELTSRRQRTSSASSSTLQTGTMNASNVPMKVEQDHFSVIPPTDGDKEYICNRPPITPIVFLIRGMVIQFALVLPVGLWWVFGIEHLLVRLGQGPDMARMAADYLRILAPSLWAYSIQWTLTAWVQTIGMADVPAVAAVIGVALHVPFNWVFVYVLGGGSYLGCAWAAVAFQVIQLLYIAGYLFVYPPGRQRVVQCTGGTAIGRTKLTFWPEFYLAMNSLSGTLQYLGLALPGMVIISEWWASETAIFLSGWLHPNPEEALGGMTIYQSINSFCFMFPMAVSVAASARVSNLLGSGDAPGAAWASSVSVVTAGVVSGSIGLLLYILPHTMLPRLFAPSEEGVIVQASQTIPLLALYVVADGIQCALNGTIKGCGRQCVTVPIVVIAYWIVGVPLAYYLALVKHGGESTCQDGRDFCGDVGLVAGMTTGTWVHMILLALVVCVSTDWSREAQKAKDRVAVDDQK
jgi:MATE family multidrug resistance protein